TAPEAVVVATATCERAVIYLFNMFQQYLYHHLNTVSPSALLFPAVNPRRRFLIHKTVEERFPDLATISVGQGDQRRTAVTFRNNQGATTLTPQPKSAITPRQH
ncbi:hypothetical protein OTU49_005311, partial [Cherax quadricarinatus]